jgi:hypothetical protein
MKGTVLGAALALGAILFVVALLNPVASAQSPVSGAIFTTLEDGSRVNANIYDSKLDVYLDGGPGPNAPRTAAGLPDGNYYFQVTDPSGKALLSSDPVLCREFRVAGGIIVEYVSEGRTYARGPKTIPCWVDGKANGRHDLGSDIDHGALTIQLMPYDNTPNKGGVYKAWATPVADFLGDTNNVDNACGTGCFHGFQPRFSKTDNFKVQHGGRPFESPTLNVRKFDDTDGDGVWDAGEPEIGVAEFVDGGGWPVSVADPNEISSNGFTPYTYLPGFAGTYTVSEDSVVGWVETAAYRDGVFQGVTSTVPVSIAFVSGETHSVIFGNFACLTVSGTKVNDLNGNGVRDDGEPGIAGWTIDLYRNGVLVATTTTGADGTYSFEVCAGGGYEVREATPPGWTPITPSSFQFTAASGVDVTGIDFLNFQCFTVSGRKINDMNGNGVQDDGDAGIAGWTIELYRDGALEASTTTGPGGSYSFSVCTPGSYVVKEVVPDGWIATNPTSGEFSFDAVSGTDHSFDFLNFQLGSICGVKWYDVDHDGVRDESEAGIPGWHIELVKDGAVVASAVADSDGRFCFTGLLAGDYLVREVMPNNPDATHVWAQTFPSGDGTWTITVQSGTDVRDADFGNVCEFTESRTWGYWKTHTGFDSPPRDPAYDLLPAHPLEVDITTPDGDKLVETDAEAKWMFDSTDPNCSGTPGVEKCRSLFRAQLLALHMNLLKFSEIGDQVYVFAGDPYSGMTVQAIRDAAVALLTDGQSHDFTSFQETIDRINNNENDATGSHVLVCPTAPTPDYS